MSEDQSKFHADRLTGIGGSDAAVVAGMSEWKTPLALYLEKRGEVPRSEGQEFLKVRKALEPAVRQMYTERTGRIVNVIDDMLRHPKHDWMVAHLDGLCTFENRGIEIKTARSMKEWGEPGTDQIPEAYLLQVQHYMAVTAIPVFDVAALFGLDRMEIYTVESDPDLQSTLIDLEAEFWKRVKNGNPPEPTCLADVRAKFRMSTATKIVADDKAMEAFARLAVAKANIKAHKAEEDAALAILCGHMGINDTLVTDTGTVLATWKQAKGRTGFDLDRFKSEHPDLYRAFLKTGEPSRRFLPKLPKEDD